ncbi:MAG: sigma 54-interacting transcriptional regulator [Dethiosulfatibacter sp.]|nr:sigma 54-interacting transcriptional regulator [Dethiosulfatibacter sp.]
MDYKILLISTYRELTEKAKRIAEDMGVIIDVFEGGILKNGVHYAKSVEANYDVIISQGGTAAAIKDIASIPVIEIEISVADLISAIYKAREYNSKMYMVVYNNKSVESLKKLKSYLNLDLTIFAYTNREELENQFNNRPQNESITLLGMGSCIEDLKSDNYTKAIIIKSTDESIREAITIAKNIVDLNKREKEKTERLKAILDYSDEGIIALDTNNVITTFNPYAEKILRVESKTILNRSILDFGVNTTMSALYGEGKIAYNMLIKIDDTQYIINRVAIIVDNEQVGLVITFKAVSQLQNLERKVRHKLYSSGFYAKYRFENIKGSSHAIHQCIKKAKKFAETDSTILIYGETGTGKELFAQSVHNYSNRRNESFVAINCAALPGTLLESELFGYEEGAFTGARKGGKIGVFELAHKGTIFLDEISEIPMELQGRLLRVLQEKEVFRIGGDQIINTDVRIIAATNTDLYQLVKVKKFREDLYFRINILNLILPSLRKRKEDITSLANEFLAIKKNQFNKDIKGIDKDAMNLIQEYSWPGNIRELENFVEKVVLLCEDSIITKELVEDILSEKFEGRDPDKSERCITIDKGSLKDMEMQIIDTITKEVGNDKALLAKKLGISRTTLWKRLKEIEETEAAEV